MSPLTETSRRRLIYGGLIAVVAVLAAGVTYLALNISERKAEATQTYVKVVELDESTVDPAIWGQNFPRQYDSYLRTVDTERTTYGGSEAFDKLEMDPRLVTIFSGYAFGIDYKEERGHAYMLTDQEETARVTEREQPGACLHCHASVLTAYYDAGVAAGAEPADDEGLLEPGRWAAVYRGFEVVNALPYAEANALVEHPVSCLDCHDPETMQLRVTRPAFMDGINVLAASDVPVPHLPSIERWRDAGREGEYDPNVEASRQELRSLACAQCHVEYYFKGEEKLLTYPWHDGLRVEQIETYYDEVGHADWEHAISGAPVLKAQHPEFETWSQGIHGRSGVACADCHMPYTREGAVKVSDHHVRSPLLNVERACQPCHPYSGEELIDRAETIQARTEEMLAAAEIALVTLIEAIAAADEAGASDAELAEARALQRRSQWRVDFVNAENSMGFHADQESARALALAIDYAGQGLAAVPATDE
jgi:nitrite reductase (cytochrome c-552)